jgi:hypothetical protein
VFDISCPARQLETIASKLKKEISIMTARIVIDTTISTSVKPRREEEPLE